MKMNKSLLIATIAALFFTNNVFSQKVKTTDPGAIVLFESCVAGDAACESTNRVRNDVAGKTYVNGSEGVSAKFYLVSGTRDLILRLDGSATRTLRLDLRDVSYAGGVPSWWYTAPQQDTKPHMNVLGAYYAKEQCGGAATCNVNYQTLINAGYWKAAGVSNTTYAMLWNPTARADRPVNSPLLTSAVNVNYIKDGAGERFIITPLPSASCTFGTACYDNPYIAGLEATSGRTVSGAGQYIMPFKMTVRLQ